MQLKHTLEMCLKNERVEPEVLDIIQEKEYAEVELQTDFAEMDIESLQNTIDDLSEQLATTKQRCDQYKELLRRFALGEHENSDMTGSDECERQQSPIESTEETSSQTTSEEVVVIRSARRKVAIDTNFNNSKNQPVSTPNISSTGYKNLFQKKKK
ncbi:Extl3 [Acrasis kona]|uniref:Extl3 n=1 Tax=Acrasis kona TaxID=1008807 RepID=A0AAW2Z239_9EUKA